MEILSIMGTVLFLIWMIAFQVENSNKIASTKNLQKNFQSLGNMTGKTKTEIISIVGPPNSVSSIGDGKVLLQWMQISSGGGYHISIIFKDDVFGGISHESAN